MDLDNAAPPPARPSLGHHAQMEETLFQSMPNQVHEDFDNEAVPPRTTRRASVSLGKPIPSSTPINSLMPKKSLVKIRPIPAPTQPHAEPTPARRFSRPFKGLLRRPTFRVQPRGSASYRSPVRSAYRKIPRPGLKLWSSLEAIASVHTSWPSAHKKGRSEPDNACATGVSAGSSVKEDCNSSAQQDTSSRMPSSTTSTSSTSSTFSCNVEPGSLQIQREVSFDQMSHRTLSSSSIWTDSSDQSSQMGYISYVPMGRIVASQDSKSWSASDYDISGLSEADIKKCKKKGINPALYAEMKAAKNGKWISPIGGSTVL